MAQIIGTVERLNVTSCADGRIQTEIVGTDDNGEAFRIEGGRAASMNPRAFFPPRKIRITIEVLPDEEAAAA